MSDENSDDWPGLYGWVPARHRRQGRPSFEWTEEKSREVMGLFAAKKSKRDAAKILGCDVKTLEKHFSEECSAREHADLIVRSRLLGIALAEAEKGNVGAIKQAIRMLDAEQMRTASARFGDGKKVAAPASLGLKPQRDQAAKYAGLDDAEWGNLLHGETGEPVSH